MCKAGYFFVFAITKIYLLLCKIWVYLIGTMLSQRLHEGSHIACASVCMKCKMRARFTRGVHCMCKAGYFFVFAITKGSFAFLHVMYWYNVVTEVA